jgi:hypothetical protein
MKMLLTSDSIARAWCLHERKRFDAHRLAGYLGWGVWVGLRCNPEPEIVVGPFRKGKKPMAREREDHLCGCWTCTSEYVKAPCTTLVCCRMFLCELCGNKRCPHATDHRLECTGSNEPGQKGSRYE